MTKQASWALAHVQLCTLYGWFWHQCSYIIVNTLSEALRRLWTCARIYAVCSLALWGEGWGFQPVQHLLLAWGLFFTDGEILHLLCFDKGKTCVCVCVYIRLLVHTEMATQSMLFWDTNLFRDRAPELVKVAIDNHVYYNTAELDRNRPVWKGASRRRRVGEQVAVNMHTRYTGPVRLGKVRDVWQMTDAQNGKGGGRHSGVPGSGKRAKSDWKLWQNPRQHPLDSLLADKFEM